MQSQGPWATPWMSHQRLSRSCALQVTPLSGAFVRWGLQLGTRPQRFCGQTHEPSCTPWILAISLSAREVFSTCRPFFLGGYSASKGTRFRRCQRSGSVVTLPSSTVTMALSSPSQTCRMLSQGCPREACCSQTMCPSPSRTRSKPGST